MPHDPDEQPLTPEEEAMVTTALQSMVAEDEATAARDLRRDLAPGPFQEMSGWAHAVPKEKREAILMVVYGYERLRRNGGVA